MPGIHLKITRYRKKSKNVRRKVHLTEIDPGVTEIKK